jgi:hypothetical protein
MSTEILSLTNDICQVIDVDHSKHLCGYEVLARELGLPVSNIIGMLVEILTVKKASPDFEIEYKNLKLHYELLLKNEISVLPKESWMSVLARKLNLFIIYKMEYK